MNGRLAWLVAIASGAALWTIANLLEGIREPWDAPAYWTIYLPTAFLLCFLLGWLAPERPWRWALGVMLAQLPVMFAFTGEVGNLLVAGIIVLLVEALPAMFAAWIGARLGKALTGGQRG